MKRWTGFITLMTFAVLAGPAWAGGAASIGLGHGTAPGGYRSGCGAIHLHADGTYENGYSWTGPGIQAPDYGAFAECYDFDGLVCQAFFDFTTLGDQAGETMDVYLWDDNAGEPGNVIAAVIGVDPGPVALWPSVSRHVVPLNSCVDAGSYWVGYWGDWPGGATWPWYIAADLDGPNPGCPFTKYSPGSGHPAGWGNVELQWEPTVALGIGAEVAPCPPDGDPNENTTLVMHAVETSFGICEIPDPCPNPVVDVPIGFNQAFYLLARNYDNLAGVQTAFDWPDGIFIFLFGPWDCQRNQLAVVSPGTPGPVDGTITTAFDCITGGASAVLGRMHMIPVGPGCMTQIESAYPFGTHVVSCTGDITPIPEDHRGSICAPSGGVDACDPPSSSAPVGPSGLASGQILLPNYPNPFGQETTIRYNLTAEAPVKLRIFNVLGEVVRTFDRAPTSTGSHSLRWDGLDDSGRPVAAGVYSLEIQTGGVKQVQKIMVLK